MNRMAMESLAQKHWAKWLPTKVAQHKADGDLGEAVQGAATRVEREIEDLMKQGYQRHEAEEVALPMFILLKPEPEAKEASWERRELAAQESNAIVRGRLDPQPPILPWSATRPSPDSRVTVFWRGGNGRGGKPPCIRAGGDSYQVDRL